MKRKILLVYAALSYPLRDNTKHLVECFRQYSDDHWFYLNLAHKSAPSYLHHIDFDLVIFQTTFVQRLSRSDAYYALMCRRAAALMSIPAPKVALVQDEFWNVGKVGQFINAFGVSVLFSVAPGTEWPNLYPGVDRNKVRFHRVLTGYLDEKLLDRLINAGSASKVRPIDIVYRAAGTPSPAWGKKGYVKQRLADAVSRLAPQFGLKADISTNSQDALFGEAWISFLASARYTIGAPSGASLLDRDGRILAKVDAYQAAHPEASFEEIESQCFAGMDGNLNLEAIGPRHIEAAATQTCQVLVEGDYNGLFKAGVHYIAVSPDLSNLSSVLSTLGDEVRRQMIAKRAFEDLILPQRITYRNFVGEVLQISLPDAPGGAPLKGRQAVLLQWMRLVDQFEWQMARLISAPIRKVRDRLVAWRSRQE